MMSDIFTHRDRRGMSANCRRFQLKRFDVQDIIEPGIVHLV